MTNTPLHQYTSQLLDIKIDATHIELIQKLKQIAHDLEQSFNGSLSVWGNDHFSNYESYFNCNLSISLDPIKDRNEMMRLIDGGSNATQTIYIDEVRDKHSKIMIVYSPQSEIDVNDFAIFKKSLVVVIQRALKGRFFQKREASMQGEANFILEQLELKVLAEQFFIQFINQEIKSKNQAISGIAELFQNESKVSIEQSEFLNAIVSSSKDLSELHILLVDWIKLKNDKIIFNGQSVQQQQLLSKIEEQLRLPMRFDYKLNEQYWNVDFAKTQQVLQLVDCYAEYDGLDVVFDERSGALQIKFSIQKKKLQIFQKFFDQEMAFQSVRYQLVDWMRIYCLNQLVKLQNGALTKDGDQWILELEFSKGVKPELLSAKPRSLKGMKLLVAEDLEINKMLLSTMLGEWGIQFEFAKNGLEALLKHKRYDYDAILMDIEMPEMDGKDTTWHIRNNFLGHKTRIPIIGMTANVDTDLKELCERLGMSGVINKPLHKISLYQELARLDEAS